MDTLDAHTQAGGVAAGSVVPADTGGSGGPRGAPPGEGSATRSRILQIALTLMAQRGVDGTSMRDLASAAGLNVASLYHYFPSKRDLLEAVLVEHGFLPVSTPRIDPASTRTSTPRWRSCWPTSWSRCSRSRTSSA